MWRLLALLARIPPEIIVAIIEALDKGTPKGALVAAIKATMVKASDARMKRELGG